MAISVERLNELVEEAIEANEAGNYSLAYSKLRSARMVLNALPETERKGSRVKWDREDIEAMMADLKVAAERQVGMAVRRSNVRYTGEN